MRRELKILLFASGFYNLAAGLFGPLYAVYVQGIGGDLLTTGGAFSVYAFATGILMFILSKWENKSKHQEVFIILGYMICSLGFFGYLFITKPIHLFFVQILFGIGNAINTPAFDGIYSDNLEKGKSAAQWGYFETMKWMVIGISAFLGGLITKLYGFRTLFTIMFMLSIFGFLSTMVFLKKK